MYIAYHTLEREMFRRIPNNFCKIIQRLIAATHAIIVAILYFGYRFARPGRVLAAAAAAVSVAIAPSSRTQFALSHSVLNIVPFNYDSNVYGQTTEYISHSYDIRTYIRTSQQQPGKKCACARPCAP